MHQSVRDAFVKVTAPIEGMVNHMYCNQDRDVITGIGIELPDATAAQQLSWRWRDTNKKANAREIAAEWKAVKWMGILGTQDNRNSVHFARHVQLMLPNKEIFRTVHDKLNMAELQVKKLFSDFERWPADAQLAVLQLQYSNTLSLDLALALQDQDFATAAALIDSVDPRSVLIKRLFGNAVIVIDKSMNPSKLLPLAH
jgi:hypothetical protein